MKFKVENTRLRFLLKEASYEDAFNQIKKGDTIAFKTGGGVYEVVVINSFSGQITFEWNGEYYLITRTSFNGRDMETIRLVIGDDGRVKRKTKGPTLKGVYNIVIKRNGQVVTGVTPDAGRPEDKKGKGEKQAKQAQLRADDLNQVFKSFDVGEVMELTTGKLITKGRDRGSLAKNTVTVITLHVEKKTNGRIHTSLVDAKGADSATWDAKYSNTWLIFDAGSFQATENGMILNIITKEAVEGSKFGKGVIPNVFGLENAGKFEEEPEITMKDIMKSPRLKQIMLKNPSLLDSLLGRGSKGIIPLEKKLSALGFNVGGKKGRKVKFKYYGDTMRPFYRFNFKVGETYSGKYISDKEIQRTGSNTKEIMIITLLKDLGDNIHEVKVRHEKNTGGKITSEELGKAKIKIIDKNF